jgi:hypothetical protein
MLSPDRDPDPDHDPDRDPTQTPTTIMQPWFSTNARRTTTA